MARLTKTDIERQLLAGRPVPWRDASGKSFQIVLTDPRERRLFQFLLKQSVREPTDLPPTFISGLSATYLATDDPATKASATPANPTLSGPWRLKSLKSEGFGGINTWGGPAFTFNFDGQSLLLEGPNGSGKSSLIGAVVWALSGERPRDQTDDRAHMLQPVFDVGQNAVGNWPPIACYPPAANKLNSVPQVYVELIFENPKGEVVKASRALKGGEVHEFRDPSLDIPSVLLETGLLMPARLAALRLGDRDGRLTSAVQKLTGLDDLIEIGLLAVGLCHGSREYQSYKKKDLAEAKTSFGLQLESARSALKGIDFSIPSFKPSDTDDKNGEFAQLGKKLTARAAELTKVVSNDLASALNLSELKVQSSIIVAIGAAKADLSLGLGGISSWKFLVSIANELDDNAMKVMTSAIEAARKQGEEAVSFLDRATKDSKFRMKAMAAQWHHSHGEGSIEACPLCEQRLKATSPLVIELEALRLAGDPAARTFEDNLNAIIAALDSALPPIARKQDTEILAFEPMAKLQNDIRTTYVTKGSYSKILVKFSEIVEGALASSPSDVLSTSQLATEETVLSKLHERLMIAQRLLDIAAWYRANSALWEKWWNALASSTMLKSPGVADATASGPESLVDHLTRLSSALEEAEPYRKAAEAVRKAWEAGKIAAPIEKELFHRQEIAGNLSQLKQLGSLSESVAREAIDELSLRIAALLKKMFITEQFQFRRANLSRKEGLNVLGGFSDDLQIDATLVANTSWLRAVLWCFLFSLRAEAVEQQQSDMFPILAFDDPQATFDNEHRHRWAQQIAELQTGASLAQVLLTTHDETFLKLIETSGVVGREAMIVAAGPELGHIGIFEGQLLEREWIKAFAAKTPRAGQDYMAEVRRYLEGLLRLMLRGESLSASDVQKGLVIGASREKMRVLHDKGKGLAPWNRTEFGKLVSLLDKDCGQIKHLEMVHHAGASSLGMAEAVDVEEYWRSKLQPALMNAFYVKREHMLLHGGQNVLHAPSPSIALPDGFQDNVRDIPLRVLGRAAALTDGRIADGRLDWSNFPEALHKKITLAKHHAYRLTVPTLEPVARPGDILLVDRLIEPTPKSLVVATHGDRVLARRLELSDKQNDVAVLTAHAIDPREIAAPVVVHKATLEMQKVVGVLFNRSSWNGEKLENMEICGCEGRVSLKKIAEDALGLVEVTGRSATPIVLDKQYIIIKKEIVASASLKHLVGSPVVAGDADENYYFKRLQMPSDDTVVLESLDIAGDYPPVVFRLSGEGPDRLHRVWPVVGVLFELPG